MKTLIKFVSSIILLLLFVSFSLFLPIPPHRVIKETFSPDQKQIAIFSWKPAGLLGLISQDNPWVYVRILNGSKDKIIEKHSTWGDVPEDAISRLSHFVPWLEKNNNIK